MTPLFASLSVIALVLVALWRFQLIHERQRKEMDMARIPGGPEPTPSPSPTPTPTPTPTSTPPADD
jgi:hypothetical protein